MLVREVEVLEVDGGGYVALAEAELAVRVCAERDWVCKGAAFRRHRQHVVRPRRYLDKSATQREYRPVVKNGRREM